MNTPTVSIVIVGRNDNYGQNFLERLQTFIRSLDWQTRNCAEKFELILVEWNPLSDRERLQSILTPTANIPLRIITVPNRIHQTLGSQIPVLEFHGKNVGARRARGEFVLTTNPDILFSDDLIAEMAQGWLRKDCVYRTDRFDFDATGISDIQDKDLLSHALQHTFCGHVMDGNASVSIQVSQASSARDLPRTRVTDTTVHTNACGDFMMASRESFFTARGLWETVDQRWHVDSNSLMRFLGLGLHQAFFVAPHCIFHQDHARSGMDAPFGIFDQGKSPGTPDWGLNNIELEEVILHESRNI